MKSCLALLLTLLIVSTFVPYVKADANTDNAAAALALTAAARHRDPVRVEAPKTETAIEQADDEDGIDWVEFVCHREGRRHRRARHDESTNVAVHAPASTAVTVQTQPTAPMKAMTQAPVAHHAPVAQPPVIHQTFQQPVTSGGECVGGQCSTQRRGILGILRR